MKKKITNWLRSLFKILWFHREKTMSFNSSAQHIVFPFLWKETKIERIWLSFALNEPTTKTNKTIVRKIQQEARKIKRLHWMKFNEACLTRFNLLKNIAIVFLWNHSFLLFLYVFIYYILYSVHVEYLFYTMTSMIYWPACGVEQTQNHNRKNKPLDFFVFGMILMHTVGVFWESSVTLMNFFFCELTD